MLSQYRYSFALIVTGLALLAGCSEVPVRHLDSRVAKPLSVPLDLDRPAKGPMAEEIEAPHTPLDREQVVALMSPPVIEQAYVAQPLTGEPSTSSSRVTRERVEGRDGLWLQEPYGRAWRLLGSALDHAGVLVEDRNRSEGLYYIQVAVDSENNAFLEYVGAVEEIVRHSLTVSIKQQAERCRIELKGRDAEGDPAIMDDLLGRLQQQLR